MRAGDFSAPGLAAIYDQSQPGNPQFQCNGVLNVICPDRLDPVAVQLFNQSYYFDEHPQYAGDSPRAGYGSAHASELPYVFRQLREHNRPPATPKDEAMSDLLRTYWTNFAKTGDPNGVGLSAWPAFSNASPRMLQIASDNTKAVPIVSEDGLKILDESFAWRRMTTGPAPAARP